MNTDDQDILQQQARLLYQQSPFANFTVIGVACLMYSLFMHNTNAEWLALWAASISALALARLYMWWQFNQQKEVLQSEVWIGRYVFMTALVGIAWGSASLFYVLIDDVQINTLFYVLISAVIAAAVPVLSAWFSAYLAYTVPPILLLSASSLYQIHHQSNLPTLSYFLAIAIIVYFMLMTSLAKRANVNILHSLKLQRKNRLLLDELNQEVESREDLVIERTQELTLANAQLQESQAHMLKLSSAVEASPNGIFITDAQGRIEYINPRCEQITGFSSQEAVGMIPQLGQQQKSPLPVCKEMWQAILAGHEWHGEIESFRKTGDRYWAKIYIAPITNQTVEVTNFVAILEDISQSKALAKQLSHQATHDNLTGLINRAEFERKLEASVRACRDGRGVHALCFLDLDQFKVINDTCGHIAGDALLRQLGKMLSQMTRRHDTLARLGGDEFAILMENCTLHQAERVANEVRELVEQFQFIWEAQLFTIGVSIGITEINQVTRDKTEVLKQADSACYAAKNQGRNRVYLFQHDDDELTRQAGEFEWVNEIKEALLEKRFELFVQPIVATKKSKGRMFEVLLRLRGKNNQLAPPGAFLPTAERYNLSERIDRWVIDHVFIWLNNHIEKLPDLQNLAINLSGASLASTELLSHITHQLTLAKFPAGRIKFEVTETAAISNLRQANNFIKALSELGCQFSLDDFGSGLSSFGYLKNLPVDSIKIDGMFVRDMLEDQVDFEMVKSINDIGHVLRLETIAEFVENQAILDKLTEIGVDYAQGYHLGCPTPIDSILQSTEKMHLVN